MKLSQVQQQFFDRVQAGSVIVEHEIYETAHGTTYSWRGGRDIATAKRLARKGLVKINKVSTRLGYYAQYSGSTVDTYQITIV